MEPNAARWLADLKGAHPHLPDRLSIDQERELLGRLGRWFAHVGELRELYDGMTELPEEFQHESGKRQIIPALMSLETMTDEETRAWHELFVMLSAHMAELACGYWAAHGSDAMTVEDVLGYLPLVFLYVLSSYDPYPKGAPEHADDFRHAGDGRVRLITWVHIEARRHINTYLQHQAYTVKQGSNYVHRLRQTFYKAQNAHYTKTGREMSDGELVEELGRTHYGGMVTSSTLRAHIHDLQSAPQTVSLSSPVNASPESPITWGDVLSSSGEDVEEEFADPFREVFGRVRGNRHLESACYKLFYTDDTLTTLELYHLTTT